MLTSVFVNKYVNYCINPHCENRQNPDNLECCQTCGTPLLVRDRYRLLQPLRPLSPRHSTEIFEVGDRDTRKVMKILKYTHPEFVERFQREAMTLQELNHPGIPHVEADGYFTFTPSGSSHPFHCFVMEKIEGENLEEWIAKNGEISQQVALKWLRQIIQILDYLHGKQFFHRDIKPSNIMLKPDGQLVPIDFGSVRAITDTYLVKIKGEINVTSVVSGGYTPPEQIDGKALPQSDFFALGRTFVYLLTGQSPHELPTDAKTGGLVWRSHAPQISKPLGDFIDELMAFSPANRPQNTVAILRYLTVRGLFLKSVQRFFESRRFKYTMLGLLVFSVLYRLSFPLQAQYYFGLGLEAQQAEEIDKAKWYYEKSLMFEGKNSKVYNNLGRICQWQNQSGCAEENYLKALKLQPDNPIARYNLAVLYDDSGKSELAEAEYEKVSESSNSIATYALSDRARLRILDGDAVGAIALSERALQQTENNKVRSALHKNLGWAYWMEADSDRARTHLEKAIALDPGRTDAYCLLAQVLEFQSDRQNALIRWQECLESDYTNPDVKLWRTLARQRVKEAGKK